MDASVNGRLLTAADVAVLPTQLPSGPIDYELIDGNLILLPVATAKHGAAQAHVMGAIYQQADQKGLGTTLLSVGLLLKRNPDTLYGPDVSFLKARSEPRRLTPDDFLESVPELVIEVQSKSDSPAYIERRTADYLNAGVEVVWIIDPEQKTASVHRANQPVVELGTNDILTAEGIIADFSLPLARLFE